ncbi:hypothetical protein GGI07_003059 [Coemansia sp. Benny D115]|nr:hypothetical protein GGI07_003059 [Coemansia sp. Benny D115]
MQFYERAADILRRLERREGSINKLTVGNRLLKPEEKRGMYALICETLRHAAALRTVVERSEILQTGALAEQMDMRLALVMTHDLLLSRGGLKHMGANAKLNLAFRKQRGRLAKELEKLMAESGAQAIGDLVPMELRDGAATFRYVRVNQLRASVEGVIAEFEADGFKLVEAGREDMAAALPTKARRFMRDTDLADVLVFPPGTDLHGHRLLVDGALVLQDKASCMPAHVLGPQPGSTALDACAAPGNKTSHMASLMGNRGTVFAFDKDSQRLATLVELTGRAHCKNIKPLCANFLEVDPLDSRYARVEYALLDPSCSGSGIVNRQDVLLDAFTAGSNGYLRSAHKDQERLNALADFQQSVILHAMNFPAVKRISYSTCSINVEENEAVVAAVLEAQDDFVLASADSVLPSWPRRGLAEGGLSAEQAASVVRTLPEDGTNGFFVAAFERKKPADIDAIRARLEDFYAARREQALNEELARQQQQPASGERRSEGAGDAAGSKKATGKKKSGEAPHNKLGSLPGKRSRSAVTVSAGPLKTSAKKRSRRKVNTPVTQ